MQGENFKWRDGARERRDEEIAEEKNPAAHFHSVAHLCLSYPPPPRHIHPARRLPLSRGAIIVNHLLSEAGVRGRWKFRLWAPQTPCHQRIKADVLWWSNTMLLWYCSTQRSRGPWLDDKVWSHFSNDTFTLSFESPAVRRLDNASLHEPIFLRRRGRVVAPRSPLSSRRSSWKVWEFVKLSAFYFFRRSFGGIFPHSCKWTDVQESTFWHLLNFSFVLSARDCCQTFNRSWDLKLWNSH